MVNLNLTGQAAEASTINPKLLRIKQLMDDRKELWDKLPIAKKKKWITSNKDPIMTAMYQVGQYIKTNFPELVE